MPTYKGAGRLDNVFWPGHIKAVSLEEMLDELSRKISLGIQLVDR